tara:strand:- start:145 stop:585 length:441 start_codon:yes stop_codon:yes gene_type:complete
MNTNKTVLSIVDKLKPAKQAVKLSALSEIEDNLDRFDYAESDASYLAYELGDQTIEAYDDFRMKYSLDDFVINGNARDLNEVAEILRNALNELEQKSEELGIDPSDVFSDFYDLKARVDNADALEKDTIEKYREVTDYTGFNNFWN